MTCETRPTCIICDEPYSISQKSHITELMQKEQIAIKHYPQTCLACIMQELSIEKSQYQSNLLNATSELKLSRKAYQHATNKHNAISSKYTYYDRQANYIQFFISQEQAKARETVKGTKTKDNAKTKPRKTNKASQAKQADIIAELLNSLTPEQQKLVLSKAPSAEVL